jgi:branched-chain amino acid transport system substrate-binding protein
VVQEIFTRLDQTDFASEMALLRAQRPDAVFHFHPGGLGIAFLRQYAQAALGIPQVLPNFSMDVTTVAALGTAAEGINLTSHWNSDFDNPANRAFVPAYRARYNRMPTYYAQQGFDTALSIAAALRQTGGSIEPARFRTAMLRADFASVRGKFRFASNQHPIQDWYAVKVERVNGELGLVTKERIFEDRADSFVGQCRL